MRVYLDNAATTQMSKEVVAEMIPFMEQLYGNPSSTHSHGREVKVALERSRKKIATLLNVTPGEIFFTSGGTESDNTALRCFVDHYSLKHAITSPLEHHAVLHTLENMRERGSIELSYVSHDSQGRIDFDHLESLLKEHPRSLVSLMHGNNEIGNLTDLNQLGTLCHEYEALCHSDTVQTMGYYPMNLAELPICSVVGSAHKFHGPKGIGFLYLKKGRKILPYLTGGAQERNMRGGTENITGIVGMTKALEMAFEHQEANKSHILSLKRRMKEQLSEKIEGVEFNGLSGDLDQSVYKVLSVSLPAHAANDMLLFNLDLKGISASGGSACSSGANRGSHVLQALNADPNRKSVRFSFSKFTTAEEIDYAVEQLMSCCQTSEATY